RTGMIDSHAETTKAGPPWAIKAPKPDYENSCLFLNRKFVTLQHSRNCDGAKPVLVGRQRWQYLPICAGRNAHDDHVRVVLCRPGLRQLGESVRGESGGRR